VLSVMRSHGNELKKSNYTEELKIEAIELDNGSTVIDCGINAEVGYELCDATEIINAYGTWIQVRLYLRHGNTPFWFSSRFTIICRLNSCGLKKLWSIKRLISKQRNRASGPARALISPQPKKNILNS